MGNDGVVFRKLAEEELGFVDAFERRQPVTRVFRTVDGRRTVSEHPFVDDWSTEDRDKMKKELVSLVRCGGIVIGAVKNGAVVGFASIDGANIGPGGKFRELVQFHVGAGERRRGIGKAMFGAVVEEIRKLGGEIISISSHSAYETVCFYRGCGCGDATWIHKEAVEREPFDCQMEYRIPKA